MDVYTKKLEAKCERLLADEITQKKADILIRKNQHIEQFTPLDIENAHFVLNISFAGSGRGGPTQVNGISRSRR